jgi:hypothetical protein
MLNFASAEYQQLISSGGLINTEKFTAIGTEAECFEDKEKKCAGYSVSGFTTVKTEEGKTEMVIDALFSWAGTEKSWDNTKTMELGWVVETNDPEFRTEKVKIKSYPRGSKPAWDPLGSPEPATGNAWRWNFVSH